MYVEATRAEEQQPTWLESWRGSGWRYRRRVETRSLQVKRPNGVDPRGALCGEDGPRWCWS